MKGCTYQQLPLTSSQLFRVVQKNAESVSHGLEAELEYIQAAQQRLHEFAIHPDNAYAGIRFLSMQRSDAKAVQAATDTIVDDLVKLMGDNELGHVWAAWHPLALPQWLHMPTYSLPIQQKLLPDGIA